MLSDEDVGGGSGVGTGKSEELNATWPPSVSTRSTVCGGRLYERFRKVATHGEPSSAVFDRNATLPS
jgi:hypothetical protein